MSTQNKIERELSKTLAKARQTAKYLLDPQKRYVVFSDQHKGARNRADDFQNCEQTYLNALDYYDDKGYTLVLLGDVEELWEEDAQDVFASYPGVFNSEATFYRADRYIRVYGNHDDFWHYAPNVNAYLHKFYPDIQPVDGVVFEFAKNGDILGEILMVHGNQGVFDLGLVSEISRIIIRTFWRTYQKITGKGRTTESEDACLRGTHDTRMYHWANAQEKLILIAGHTHRPVWSSMTHIEQIRDELYVLQQASPRPQNYEGELKRLQNELHKRTEEHPPCNDTIKTDPCYFNTGCCCYEDGDITGIELENDWIRLIKWDKHTGLRTILQETLLTDIFDLL
jgi:UDP-2,3-diacylglucosamine pyrophosphatase LpxH